MLAIDTTNNNPRARTFGAANPAISAKGMSITDAVNLHSALATITDVLSGLASQPRFQGRGGEVFSVAGDELDSMAEAIGFRMSEIVGLIRASRPENDFIRHKRAAFLAIYAIEDDGDEADQIIAPFMATPS